MSDVKSDGGYAFPCDPPFQSNRGMTLRAYFAGRAMQGWISAIAADENAARTFKKAGVVTPEQVEQLVAKCSVDMADALIAELEKEKQS